MSQQCDLIAKKVDGIQGCKRKRVAGQERWWFPPSRPNVSGVMCPVLVFSIQEDKDILEWVQWRATEKIQELKHVKYKERLRELSLLSLQKRTLQGDLLAVYNKLVLGGSTEKKRTCIFQRCTVKRQAENYPSWNMGDFDSLWKLFFCMSSQTLVHVSQSGCGGSIPVDIQNSTVQGPD